MPSLNHSLLVIGLVVLAGLAALLAQSGFGTDSQPTESLAPATLEVPQSLQQANDSPKYEVIVNRPDGPPVVKVANADPLNRSGEIACSTCHSVRPPNLENEPSLLNEFHQGLTVDHGRLKCYACHHPEDADALRSADGAKVAYRNVMDLCSQCHSGQAVAFQHGAHGGMNGHWDLNRGKQTKNNCIDCHDPHAPSYPRMIVTFKPKDRFNGAEATHAEPE